MVQGVISDQISVALALPGTHGFIVRGSHWCVSFGKNGNFVLCRLAATVRAIASSGQQDMVANRTPSTEVHGPTAAEILRAGQEYQQDNCHCDCSPRQKFLSQPNRFIRNSSVGNPIRHDQDVGREENEPNQSQHNDFSNCQTHHLSLSKMLMFTNIDGSARRWVAQGNFMEKVLELT